MALLPDTVENLARMGANIEVTAETNYLPQTLEKLAQIAGNNITFQV